MPFINRDRLLTLSPKGGQHPCRGLGARQKRRIRILFCGPCRSSNGGRRPSRGAAGAGPAPERILESVPDGVSESTQSPLPPLSSRSVVVVGLVRGWHPPQHRPTALGLLAATVVEDNAPSSAHGGHVGRRHYAVVSLQGEKVSLYSIDALRWKQRGMGGAHRAAANQDVAP